MDASAVPMSAAHLPKYEALYQELAATFPEGQLVRDPLRKLAYGTDASFYRLIPELVVIIEDEAEVGLLLAACRRHGTPVTFRAAGTSLSGQAVTDSVLALLGDGWGGVDIAEDAATIRLQPGVLGSEANRHLARFGRKIGPDPASINACKIGGIAANNASGMCCGTAQNSYNTIAGMRVMLADGGVLDTRDAASRAAFAGSHGALLEQLRALGERTRADRRTGCPHPSQVRDQEHHRLQPQRAGRFRRPVRHPRTPDDRLGGDARLHLRDHLPHGAGVCRQGERADAVSQRRRRVRGDRSAEARAGGGGRADGSREPALGRGQAGHAGVHPRPAGRRYGAAGRNPRREPRPPRGEHRRDRCRRGRSADPAAGRLHRRSRRVREAVEHPQGVVPGRRRNARDRDDGDHRGRRLPDREPGAGHRAPAGAAGRVRLSRGDPVRPRPGRQSALRLHPGFRQRRARSIAIAASWTRSAR